MSPRSAFEEILLYLATAHILSAAVLAPLYQYNATHIHYSVKTAEELLSQDTALIHNHKSILSTFALKRYWLHVSFVCCSDVHFFKHVGLHPKHAH